MNTQKLSAFAPVVLRVTLSAVYIWFGVSQLVDTATWVGIVPAWATGMSGMSAATLVHMNGIFEVIAGTLLVLGVYTRWVALLLFLHLIVIGSEFGLSATGVRDMGLAFSTLAASLFGDDMYSLVPSDKKKI